MVIESVVLVNYGLMAVAGGSATLAFKIIYSWLREKRNGNNNGKSRMSIDIFSTVIAMNVNVQDIKKTLGYIEEKIASLDKTFAVHVEVSKKLEKKISEIRDIL